MALVGMPNFNNNYSKVLLGKVVFQFFIGLCFNSFFIYFEICFCKVLCSLQLSKEIVRFVLVSVEMLLLLLPASKFSLTFSVKLNLELTRAAFYLISLVKFIYPQQEEHSEFCKTKTQVVALKVLVKKAKNCTAISVQSLKRAADVNAQKSPWSGTGTVHASLKQKS